MAVRKKRAGYIAWAAFICTAVMFLQLHPVISSAAAGEFSVTEIGGAKLMFHESGHDEIGSIFAVMLAGHAHQRDGEAHCAHIAEHTVFHYPVEGTFSLQEWIGTLKGPPTSQYNGWAGWDHTQFEVCVPNQYIPEALRRLVQGMFPAAIDKDAYELQMRERLGRELKYMTQDELSGSANFIISSFYQGTPYDTKVFDVPIESVPQEEVLAWMKREYSPQRLIIVVVAKTQMQELIRALDSTLQGVSLGLKPTTPEVRLNPPEFVTRKIPLAREPIFITGFGVDNVSPEDHLPLAVVLSLAQRRILAKEVPGLEVYQGLTSGMSTATTRAVFVAYHGKAMDGTQSDEQDIPKIKVVLTGLVRNVLSDLVSGGLTSDEVQELLKESTGTLPSVEGIPSTLIEAWQRGIKEVPGVVSDVGSLKELSSEEALSVIASTAQKYLPRIKLMIAQVEPGNAAARGRSVPLWSVMAFVLIAIPALILAMKKLSPRKS